MDEIRPLIRVQLFAIALFALVKFGIRPRLLAADAPSMLDIFVLSFPNFCEAIVGTMTLSALALVANKNWLESRYSEMTVYLAATAATGVYVILQEFKIHNLGGRNVYDPWDVVYSVAGLAVSFGILLWLRPRVS